MDNHLYTFHMNVSKVKYLVFIFKCIFLYVFAGRAYSDLYNKVSLSLDQHLNNEVSRQLLEEYPINTKSDLVLDAAQDGAVSLLKVRYNKKSSNHYGSYSLKLINHKKFHRNSANGVINYLNESQKLQTRLEFPRIQSKMRRLPHL